MSREDPVNLILVIIGSSDNYQCLYDDLEVIYRRLCRKIHFKYNDEVFHDSTQQLCYGRGIKYALNRQNIISLLAIGAAESIVLRCIRPDICKIIDVLKERIQTVRAAERFLSNPNSNSN